MRKPTTLVQPTLVWYDKHTTSHEQLIEAVALASVTSVEHHPTDPLLETWLSGAFTKTVRKAKSHTKFTGLLSTQGDNAQSINIADAYAFTFPITSYETMMPELRKAQVSGIDQRHIRTAFLLPSFSTLAPDRKLLDDPDTAVIEVLLNQDVDMTTGKAAAQAAHGAMAGWLWRRDLGDKVCSHCIVFRWSTTSEIGDCPVVIADNGLTEVGPGTVTCGARLYSR